MNQIKQPLWLVNNILFCHDREKHTGNGSERKQQFLKHKGNQSNNKEVYTDRSKSPGRKVGFVAVFKDINRRGTLPEEHPSTQLK